MTEQPNIHQWKGFTRVNAMDHQRRAHAQHCASPRVTQRLRLCSVSRRPQPFDRPAFPRCVAELRAMPSYRSSCLSLTQMRAGCILTGDRRRSTAREVRHDISGTNRVPTVGEARYSDLQFNGIRFHRVYMVCVGSSVCMAKLYIRP